MFYDQYYIKKGWCRSSLYLRSISREGGGGRGERQRSSIPVCILVLVEHCTTLKDGVSV